MNEKIKDVGSRSTYQQLIKSGDFIPFFQPIVCLEDQRVVGFELLARRILPTGLIMSPADFISIMEYHGLLNELMKSLMAQGFMTAQTWPENLFLSINVSPSQLKGSHLPELIGQLAEQYNFSLSRLKIEITETALIDDVNATRTEVEALSEMGCMIAMDDFGTGCSSLSWLIQLPASTLKIDRSFIRSMLEKKYSRKIISSVVGLGRSLDMDVIAEGVETEEEAEMLRSIGCPYAQGYLFGKPVPAEAISSVITSGPDIKFNHRVVRMSLEQRAHQISSMYAAPGTSICFLNPELIIVDASDTFAERVGWPVQDITHRHIFDVIPSQANLHSWLQEFRIKGLPYPPFEVKLPGGTIDLVLLTRVEDEAKDLLGFCIFGVSIDRQTNITCHSK